MKYLILTAMLSVVATPRLSNSDPYAKYDLVIAKAQSSIDRTKASIDEAKAMTEEKVQEIHKTMAEAEKMAQKVELLEMVCEVYSVPVPESIEDLEAERVADSVRVQNMQKINEKNPWDV